MINRALNLLTHRIHELPVLVMMPHSRCNCRCVMCDIWKANNDKRELAPADIEKHLHAFRRLKVREVVLSGGEALMHQNLWTLCGLLHQNRTKITLLSTGLLLSKFAKEIVNNIDEVIISVDGSPAVHDRIRNIPNAFAKLVEGIRAIRELKSDFRITGRCVLQRYNYRDLPNIIESAHAAALDQISFLPADVSTPAFNHVSEKEPERIHEIALTSSEAKEFEVIVERTFSDFEGDYISRYIAESPEKMRKIPRYYLAINGQEKFVAPPCNAPWISAVLESDGRLMPCFFHKEYGNVLDQDLLSVINSPAAVQFRKTLDVKTNAVCQRCVCSLKFPVI